MGQRSQHAWNGAIWDACDSYHRYREDVDLLADAGLTAYRFSLEWSRIEPTPGHFSRAGLAHYRRMIEYCFERNVTPIVTLQHFTTPVWFANNGGWLAVDATDKFRRYVTQCTSILDGVEWVVTMNEPNMLAAIMTAMRHLQRNNDVQWQSPTVEGGALRQQTAEEFLTYADPEIGRVFTKIHHEAREIVRAHTDARVGWTVAAGALTRPLAEKKNCWKSATGRRTFT